MQRLKMAEQTQIVRKVFGKAKARVQHNALGRNTRFSTGDHALLEKLTHLEHHITIMRILLHRAGLSKHVHQANSKTTIERSLKRSIAAQGTDIIDHARTQASPLTHHCRRRSVQ